MPALPRLEQSQISYLLAVRAARLMAGNPPPITNGADGLPHCTRCDGDDLLCAYHRGQIATALGQLKTAGMLGRTEHVLRTLPPVRHGVEDAE